MKSSLAPSLTVLAVWLGALGAARADKRSEEHLGKASETGPDESGTPRSPGRDRERSKAPFDGRAFSLEAHAAYGAPTSTVYGLRLNPSAWGVGVRLSWMTKSGLWMGIAGTYSFGRAIDQTYEPPYSSKRVPVVAQSQASTLAPQVGFDMRLDPLVVRYLLGVGATHLSWDFGDTGYSSLAGFYPMDGSAWSMHIAPGVGFLIPWGPFFAGVEFVYRIEPSDQLPNVFSTSLHLGWRL